MNILVVGSGGREHAICDSFAKSPLTSKLFCAPGNAGIAQIAECISCDAEDIAALVREAEPRGIDLTFVGGEGPLAAGIADVFSEHGLRIIGPSRKAAELESSKAFAKDFMRRHGIPTAEYAVVNSVEDAKDLLNSSRFGSPTGAVVVKADGLAAGKGVVVASDRAEAVAAVSELRALAGEKAAARIVVEECLIGREVSLLMFADGEDFALMPPTRDHKRIGEGDMGPNTGGMGTITDTSLLSQSQLDEIIQSIVQPTLRGCIDEGFPFRGILFIGLMMTDQGPKVLEYNVRFGDPETQSILVRLETDMVEICEAMLDGSLGEIDLKWRPGNSATIVLAARDYPRSPQKGDLIQGLDEAAKVPGVSVFHAGTARTENGDWVTSGGRVLGITAIGSSLDSALGTAYNAAEKVWWDGMQYRRDIGK